MLNFNGWDDVQPALPGDTKLSKLPPGGYICSVANSLFSKSKADNPLLVLHIDIAEGDFKGFFLRSSNRAKSFHKDFLWDNSAIFRQLIFNNIDSKKPSPFFKGLISCFEHNNPSFKFNPNNFDVLSLRGLLIGFIFAEEEYEKRDKSIGVKTVIKFPCPIDKIRSGDFNLPELKKLDKLASSSKPDNDFPNSVPVNDDDIPF